MREWNSAKICGILISGRKVAVGRKKTEPLGVLELLRRFRYRKAKPLLVQTDRIAVAEEHAALRGWRRAQLVDRGVWRSRNRANTTARCHRDCRAPWGRRELCRNTPARRRLADLQSHFAWLRLALLSFPFPSRATLSPRQRTDELLAVDPNWISMIRRATGAPRISPGQPSNLGQPRRRSHGTQ